MQPTKVDAAGATVLAEAHGADVPIAQGGQLLANRYEILRLIGTGGMGRVYRVRDRELDEIVASRCCAMTSSIPMRCSTGSARK